MRTRAVMVVILVAFALTACSRSKHLHIRGQLDRTNWVARTCDSRDSYRVIMTSGQWAGLLDYQRQFSVTDAEPLIIEFDGMTIPPKWPGLLMKLSAYDGSMLFERGTCP